MNTIEKKRNDREDEINPKPPGIHPEPPDRPERRPEINPLAADAEKPTEADVDELKRQARVELSNDPMDARFTLLLRGYFKPEEEEAPPARK